MIPMLNPSGRWRLRISWRAISIPRAVPPVPRLWHQTSWRHADAGQAGHGRAKPRSHPTILERAGRNGTPAPQRAGRTGTVPEWVSFASRCRANSGHIRRHDKSPWRWGRKGPPDAGDHPTRRTQLMLPDPHDPPTLLAKCTRHQPVPRLVRRELPQPERPPRLRNGGVFRTEVPETAIHEYGDPLPSEHEIRPSRDSHMPTPTRNSVLPESPDEHKFGTLVPPSPYPGHDLGSFGLRKNVSHSSK